MAVQVTEKQEGLLSLRIFTEMHRRGLSIPKLARDSHVPLSTVQKLCAGAGKHPSIWTIRALAQALEVSLDYLVGDTDSRCGSPPSATPAAPREEA